MERWSDESDGVEAFSVAGDALYEFVTTETGTQWWGEWFSERARPNVRNWVHRKPKLLT